MVQAQQSLNSYKYVIVPKKYAFLKEENKYRLNTLTKLLLEESNFTAYYDGNTPPEYDQNPCEALTVDLDNESGMFSTKINVVLKDCRNKIVYRSEEGKSRIKEFEPAYHEALKNAFESVKALNYKYTPGQQEVRSTVPVATSRVEEKSAEVKNIAVETSPVVEKEIESVPVQETVSTFEGETEVIQGPTLYAQPVAEGFQLVDTTPKVVYIIQKTSFPNVFVIKDKNGVLHLKNNVWTAEYYEGSKLIIETLNIKF